MQVQDQPAQMWNQAQAALQKIPPVPMSMKQPQQQQQQAAFYMAAQDPLKLYEHQMDKKMKFPNVKIQDFYWEPTYRMGDGLPVMADRMKRPPPGGICPEQDGSTGPRGPPFEVRGRRGETRGEEEGGRGDVLTCCSSLRLLFLSFPARFLLCFLFCEFSFILLDQSSNNQILKTQIAEKKILLRELVSLRPCEQVVNNRRGGA